MVTEVEVCNRALIKVGCKTINALSETGKRATTCAVFLPQVVDEVLADHNWNFATGYAQLEKLGTAPLFEFDNAYSMPLDCVKVRQMDDETAEFEVVSGEDGQTRVLYTDEDPALIKYTRRITTASAWPPKFVEAVACKLAAELAVPLTSSTKLEQSMMTKYVNALASAQDVDSSEGLTDPERDDSWIRARF